MQAFARYFSLKPLKKKVTVDSYLGCKIMMSRINNAIWGHGTGINLGLKKKATLLGFLVMLLHMISEVARPHHIIDGFITCGMLDAKTRICPDMDCIISTYHRDISVAE